MTGTSATRRVDTGDFAESIASDWCAAIRSSLEDFMHRALFVSCTIDVRRTSANAVPVSRIPDQHGAAGIVTLEEAHAASFFAERTVDPPKRRQRTTNDALQKLPRVVAIRGPFLQSRGIAGRHTAVFV
ncbi:hypothetical protein [Paraburkholderia phosphatilytica]|uniref:hypothetical protein n=1 Tax=Paraburkholderia phosphatilytica TaxID=2282883 RepID=UPI000F5FF155|nr:hypothetical protein [Paraburkholderia phosphatilytica]